MPVKYLDSTHFAAIKVKAANIYVADTFVPCSVSESGVDAAATGAYRADGLDVVVTKADGSLVPREIAAFDRVGGTFQIWFRDPSQDPVLGGTQLYLQWGGASVNVANDATVWSGNYGGGINHAGVLHCEEVAANLTDAAGNYTPSDANLAYAATGKIDNGVEFNGNNSKSALGDVIECNSAGALTVSQWINQDVLDTVDIIWEKLVDGNNNITVVTLNTGVMAVYQENGGLGFGSFDYSTVISAGTWYKLDYVFDGSLTGNANRLKLYIDGVLMTLSFLGTIQATTANLAAANFTFGAAGAAFDGKQDEMRIVAGALSANQIKGQYDNQNGFATNATITTSTPSEFTSGAQFFFFDDDNKKRKFR